MKSSACCTTPSKAAAAFKFLVLLLASTAVGPLSRAQNTVPETAAISAPAISLTPEAILAANTLQGEGKRPFHLKVRFQIFDLQGKAGEQGTLEYWWAAAEGSRLDITTPSLGTIHSTEARSVNLASARILYLIGKLLEDVCFPGAELGIANPTLSIEPRIVSNISLVCMHPALPPSKYAAAPISLCADSATGTIRLITGEDHEITRNMVGRFAGTRVTLDDTMVWGGRKAATAHIERLETFDPVNTTIALERQDARTGAKPAD